MAQEKPIKELMNFAIINADKPCGPTSFQIDLKIKRALGLSKAAHGGTLDPLVSGVLPVLLGRACRLSNYFMHKDKTYVGIMQLHKDISDEELKSEMQQFVGKIKQMPPVKSRVKRQERVREVKRFEILEKDERKVLFLAEVQAGTYIRKICSDLGDRIGGAHMAELRRTKAGIFSEQDKSFVNMYTIQEAIKEYKEGKEEKLRNILIPAEEAIKNVLPSAQVKPGIVNQLLIGKPLMKHDIIGKLPQEERFAVFCGDRLIEIARKTSEGDIIARAEFVLDSK